MKPIAADDVLAVLSAEGALLTADETYRAVRKLTAYSEVGDQQRTAIRATLAELVELELVERTLIGKRGMWEYRRARCMT